MKRYLIKGALALIAGLFITSCSHETQIDYTPVQDQKVNQFEKAFKAAFTDNIDPNQDWGFDIEKTSYTRTANPNGNEWANKGYDVPSPITADELAKVLNVFNQQGAEKYTSLIEWDEFFVQQVYKGVALYTDSAGNEGVLGSNKMNWLFAVKSDGTKDHINNFNAGDNKSWDGIMLMVNSSTHEFGFSNSNGQGRLFKNFRMEKIDGNYYVGFDFESWRSSEANGNEGVKRDYIYNDWIVKIVPGNGSGGSTTTDHEFKAKTRTTKTEYFKKRTRLQYGRVFCEDLGGKYEAVDDVFKDFDYNDVVFDAYLWKEVEWKKVTVYETREVSVIRTKETTDASGNTITTEEVVSTYTSDPEIVSGPTESINENASPKYYADICLLATGATKALKVGGRSTTEVHSAFGGYSVDCMINTFDENSERQGGFGYHVTAEPVTFEQIDVTEFISSEADETINSIPIYVLWDSNTGGAAASSSITAVRGDVPQKFMSKTKEKWTSERCFLGDAYPNFTNWVSNKNNPFTTGSSENHLYQGYPSKDAGLDFNVPIGDQSTTRSEIIRTTYEDTTDDSLVAEVEESGISVFSGSIDISAGYNGGIVISQNDIKDATATSQLVFYGEATGWWQICINGTQVASGQQNEWTDSFTFTFGNQVNSLTSGNIYISGNCINLSSIVFMP